MLSLAIFKGTTLLLVTIFRVIQLPGWAINCLLCLFRQSVITAVDTVFDIAGKWVASAVDTGSELITNATTTAVNTIVEVATVQKELLVNATAEVYEFVSETGVETWSIFCKNFWDAANILMKNDANK